MTNAEAYCILKSAINNALMEKRANWLKPVIRTASGVSNVASKSPAQALSSVRYSLGGNLATNSSKAYSTASNFRSMPAKVDTPAATTLSSGGSGSTSVLNAPKTGGTPTTIPAPTPGGTPAPTPGGTPAPTPGGGAPSGSVPPPASAGWFGTFFVPTATALGGGYAGYAAKGAQQSAQDNKAIEDMKQYIAKLEEERKNNYGMLDPNGMDFWDRLAFLFQGNNYKAY